jgi:hypothetical protein
MKDYAVSELFGWLGSMCFAACGFPQAWQCIKQGNSHGLSPWMLGFWLGGEFCYIVASLLQFGWVGWLMFNYILNVPCVLLMLWYYFRPRR